MNEVMIAEWCRSLQNAWFSNKQEKILQAALHVKNRIVALDNREGTEILADSGCIGGVVPYDGNHKDEVAQFFEERKMSVAFVAPENRGFSKH